MHSFNKAEPHIINFESIGTNSLGYISVAEFPNTLPFEVKRVYWTYYTPNNVIRGNHAHKSLQQIIVALSGSIKFNLENSSGKKFNFELNNPNNGLYIPSMYWRAIQFSHNAVLLCMASMEYSEADYIRDHNVFKSMN